MSACRLGPCPSAAAMHTGVTPPCSPPPAHSAPSSEGVRRERTVGRSKRGGREGGREGGEERWE
eukprot:2185033-Rhodomonas_salina.1